jgi:AmmeMemoRadiSam system protein A
MEEMAMHDPKSPHHPLVQLARAAIDAFVRDKRELDPREAPEPVEGEPAGVFVTLHSARSHELRGCIGTIGPTEPTLEQEVINNAISSATRDWRFYPVAASELDDLEIDVSVLHPPEPIDSTAQLDPKHYGVIVQRGGRRGLLLPDIEGVDDVETQVSIARQKAGIGPHDPVKLHRFRVEKFT